MRRIYDSLPRWRRPVLVLLAVTTAALVSQIPRLQAVFAPEELVPLEADEAARLDAILSGFEGREETLLVLVEADDVLSSPALAYQHALSLHLAEQPWVARAESVTTTPMARTTAVDDGSTLETLEALDDDAIDPRLEEGLGRVLATDPARFPLGLASIDGSLRVTPLVEGSTVEPEEREAIGRALEARGVLTRRLIDERDPHRLAAVAAVATPGLSEEELSRATRELSGWIGAHPAPDGVRVSLGGLPAVRVAMVDALQRDQLVLIALALLGSFLVLLAGFRSAAGVLLPLGAAGMTSGIVVGAMAALGEPLNLLNNVVPPLLITIGLGDSVHLLVRHREELRRTPDRIAAARRTMRAMVGACFLTSATTAVGFGSLVVSHTEVLRRFAITAALGVMLAYVITVLFLPAALPDFELRTGSGARSRWLERVLGRLTVRVARRAWVFVALSIALLLGSVALARTVRVDSALLDQLEPGSEARLTSRRLEEDLGGVRMLEIGLRGEPGRFEGAAGVRELASLEAWLRDQPGVIRVGSGAELVEALWAWAAPDAPRASAWQSAERAEALVSLAALAIPERWSRWVSDDGARARVEVRLEDRGERAIHVLLERIEARARRIEGAEVALGGEAFRSARGLDRLVDDLTSSLALAVLVIFVMLGLMLRSAKLALLSVLPNALPLTLTVAWMALRDIPLHASTAIVFTVSIGLVVDGTIHVLARYREEIGLGRRRERALVLAMRGSGRAVVIGALTMLLGFVALLFGSFVPIRLFAELSIVAISSALLAELFVLAPLLALFGPQAATDAEARRAAAVAPSGAD